MMTHRWLIWLLLVRLSVVNYRHHIRAFTKMAFPPAYCSDSSSARTVLAHFVAGHSWGIYRRCGGSRLDTSDYLTTVLVAHREALEFWKLGRLYIRKGQTLTELLILSCLYPLEKIESALNKMLFLNRGVGSGGRHFGAIHYTSQAQVLRREKFGIPSAPWREQTLRSHDEEQRWHALSSIHVFRLRKAFPPDEQPHVQMNRLPQVQETENTEIPGARDLLQSATATTVEMRRSFGEIPADKLTEGDLWTQVRLYNGFFKSLPTHLKYHTPTFETKVASLPGGRLHMLFFDTDDPECNRLLRERFSSIGSEMGEQTPTSLAEARRAEGSRTPGGATLVVKGRRDSGNDEVLGPEGWTTRTALAQQQREEVQQAVMVGAAKARAERSGRSVGEELQSPTRWGTPCDMDPAEGVEILCNCIMKCTYDILKEQQRSNSAKAQQREAQDGDASSAKSGPESTAGAEDGGSSEDERLAQLIEEAENDRIEAMSPNYRTDHSKCRQTRHGWLCWDAEEGWGPCYVCENREEENFDSLVEEDQARIRDAEQSGGQKRSQPPAKESSSSSASTSELSQESEGPACRCCGKPCTGSVPWIACSNADGFFCGARCEERGANTDHRSPDTAMERPRKGPRRY